MGGGPPCFPQGSSCPVVLRILPRLLAFHLPGCHLLWPAFPKPFGYTYKSFMQSTTPTYMYVGLGSFPFARRYLGNRCFFLFLPVLRCFSSRSAPRMTMYSSYGDCALPQPGFPIQISTDQSLLAAPRGFSQLATSFFGAWCHWHPPCALVRLIT